METAPITHPVMEIDETGERLEGQTLGLIPVRYFEQIRHIWVRWSGASREWSSL